MQAGGQLAVDNKLHVSYLAVLFQFKDLWCQMPLMLLLQIGLIILALSLS